MQATIKTVNAVGLEEIRAFLLENQKNPELLEGTTKVTMEILHAWAADAEFSLAEGNGAVIELPARSSLRGITQTFEISAAGLDSENVEIEE